MEQRPYAAPCCRAPHSTSPRLAPPRQRAHHPTPSNPAPPLYAHPFSNTVHFCTTRPTVALASRRPKCTAGVPACPNREATAVPHDHASRSKPAPRSPLLLPTPSSLRLCVRLFQTTRPLSKSRFPRDTLSTHLHQRAFFSTPPMHHTLTLLAAHLLRPWHWRPANEPNPARSAKNRTIPFRFSFHRAAHDSIPNQPTRESPQAPADPFPLRSLTSPRPFSVWDTSRSQGVAGTHPQTQTTTPHSNPTPRPEAYGLGPKLG